MIELILASGNPHKAEEIGFLLDSNLFKIEAAPSQIEVEENGLSYSENALLKAKSYYDKYKVPTIADDSGLNVLSLPDELGIYSARFGGAELSYEDKIDLLISKLEGKDRTAYFCCVLCFYLAPSEIFFFEGRVNGSIGFMPLGEHGFGYDPVFHPEGLDDSTTLAMVPDWKDKNSHRAVACQFANNFFSKRVCQI